MALTQQMRIELVNVATLFAADITFPWVSIGMTTFMQKIKSLIGKSDTAKDALQPAQRAFTRHPPNGRVRRLLWTRRGDDAVCRRGVVVRRTLGIGVRSGGAPSARRVRSSDDLPLQIVPQQALQRRHLYERTQAAGRRRLHLHAPRRRSGHVVVDGSVPFADVVGLFARFLFYWYQRYRRRYARFVVDAQRVRLHVTAGRSVGIRIGRLGRPGAFAVDPRLFVALPWLHQGILLVVR